MLIKSRFVFNAALHNPNVAEIVKDKRDTIEWMEKEIGRSWS
jgi:hypothetical protein